MIQPVSFCSVNPILLPANVMYRVYFLTDGIPVWLSDIHDCLACEWCFEQEDSMEFEFEQIQPMVDIIQNKYPDITFLSTYDTPVF